MSANVSPWKAFLISSSVFKDKVRAYQLYSLMAYHTLGWKGLPQPNTKNKVKGGKEF
jgi:hypothetical protein